MLGTGYSIVARVGNGDVLRCLAVVPEIGVTNGLACEHYVASLADDRTQWLNHHVRIGVVDDNRVMR